MPPTRCYQNCKVGKDVTHVVEATSTTIVMYEVFALKVRVIHKFEDEYLSHTLFY